MEAKLVEGKATSTRSPDLQNKSVLPGQWRLVEDFSKKGPSSTPRLAQGSLRLLSWNIERGYANRLPGIIKELQGLDPDIILLQEVDVGCERTGNVDVGLEIAKALGMNYLFCTEFEEIASPTRTPDLQGGGVHGNAIISRFKMQNPKSSLFTAQPVNWEADKKNPRKGGRCWMSTVLKTPIGDLLCYNIHLEVLCGMAERIKQFLEVASNADNLQGRYPLQIIGGDFNTISHGMARFVPQLILSWADLRQRFTTLGWSEPMWWQKSLFDESRMQTTLFDDNGAEVKLTDCSRFQDPWDKDNDVTIGWYPRLFSAKCDWILFSGLQITNKKVGDWSLLGKLHAEGLSDHVYIHADVSIKK